jgi:carotenoid cleavage dioxygenase
MLHVVTVDGSRVRYRNRWVLTSDLVRERKLGRSLHHGAFEADANGGGEARGPKNWSNTNVVAHAGKLLSLYEGSAPYELNDSFGTVGEYTFDDMLPNAMTAHPKIDPVWDEMCFFRYSAEPPYLMYGVVDPRGEISRTMPIDIPRPVLMHDFAITDQHVVFFDSPAVIDPAASATGAPMVRWMPEHGTRIGVMSRDRDQVHVRWFPVENCFAGHFVNAYTEGDSVVVDYIHRPSFELDAAVGVRQCPTLHRAVIDLGRGVVRDEMLDPTPMDFPRIDDRRTGLQYRYGYLAAVTHGDGAPKGVGFDTLARYDVQSRSIVHHRFDPGVVVGEPLFVPRPDSITEGDGWVLTLSYDCRNDRSELVIIDAMEFANAPLARVRLPRRIPAGLHGAWVPTPA